MRYKRVFGTVQLSPEVRGDGSNPAGCRRTPAQEALQGHSETGVRNDYGQSDQFAGWRTPDYDLAEGETMRNLARGLALLLLAASSTLNAQGQTDDEAVRKLPQAFCEAWAKHDGHQLARIMADDVDFVNVGAHWLHGRSDFEKYHSRLLSGRFKGATLTLLQTEVRFLQSDMAVIHWSWKIDGDKNFDGTPRQQRFGLMTMVAQKRSGAWQVVVAQNTNAMPGTPPEIEGIKTPIAIPDIAAKP
jgi:uncharacterized protein (TIGR02246 family)